MITLSHDPFARQSLVREAVTGWAHDPTCTWCGQSRNPMYRYGTERDDNSRVNWHSGQFCNKGCHDSYHS